MTIEAATAHHRKPHQNKGMTACKDRCNLNPLLEIGRRGAVGEGVAVVLCFGKTLVATGNAASFQG
jgi:hypothetical protein